MLVIVNNFITPESNDNDKLETITRLTRDNDDDNGDDDNGVNDNDDDVQFNMFMVMNARTSIKMINVFARSRIRPQRVSLVRR